MGNIKCCNLMRLRQLARLWQKLTTLSKTVLSDVPAGHVAVRVGITGRRFVIRASHLNHPVFRRLLDEAYELYGHDQQGTLAIPCDEIVFRDILKLVGKDSVSRRTRYGVDEREWRESRPLLDDFVRSVDPN